MNRRGFFGALLSVPVAAVAVVVAEKVKAAPPLTERCTIKPVTYKWGSFHDGLDMDERDLQALLRENMETLKRGFEENFDLMLHRSS